MLGAPESFGCSCSAALAVFAQKCVLVSETPAKSAQPTGVDMLSLFVAIYVWPAQRGSSWASVVGCLGDDEGPAE